MLRSPSSINVLCPNVYQRIAGIKWEQHSLCRVKILHNEGLESIIQECLCLLVKMVCPRAGLIVVDIVVVVVGYHAITISTF